MLFSHQDSNLPAGFNEKDYYPELNTKYLRSNPKPVEMTDAEREAQAEAFKYIDEYDKRSKGQQFQ